MLRTTVFTSCRFAIVLLFFAGLPVHASRFRPYNVIGQAASKAANALSFINKGGLRLRQQDFAPGNPQYLAEVVAWACDTVSVDLVDRCVTDLTAAIQDSTIPYCASAQNELTICLVDQPQDCTDSQVSFDDCANFTIATYDYCIGLGYTTLPELPDCANSELSGTPVNPYDGSAATTTDNWYGYTDGAAATTDSGYGFTDSAAATMTDEYGYGFTDLSTPTTASRPAVVVLTTITPIAVPTTQLITYVTIIGTTTITVTNTTVVPTTLFTLQTVTTTTPTAVPSTTTIVVTQPTTYVTTTTVSGLAAPVTVTSSVVSTIYTCSGGCAPSPLPASTTTIVTTQPTTIVTTTTVSGTQTCITLTSSVVSTIYTCSGGCPHPTPSLHPESSLCVRRSSVRLIGTSTRALPA